MRPSFNKSTIFRLADALYMDFVGKYGNIISWGVVIRFLRRMDDWRMIDDNTKDDIYNFAKDYNL